MARIVSETELQARIDAAWEAEGQPILWHYDRADFLAEDEFTEPESCEWFVNNATTPSWCCNTHMYDGTGDYVATEPHPIHCDFADELASA